jgi:UDP-4-amino-4,6-dideoxy-N-acetyl-beta-L-altrosamine transaminase
VIPYGRQSIDEEDIRAVVEVLRSDWLTTGPAVAALERAFASATGAGEAVAYASGTAALHGAMHALGIGPGDEVILPAMTFVASANAVLYQGGTPVFADLEPDTLLLDPQAVACRIGPRSRAILAVDYAGQPCDYAALRALAERHGLALVADACHSLGGAYRGTPVGALADLSLFSFHPVKAITSGEGGMVTLQDPHRAAALRRFRSHGIDSDFRRRQELGTWEYDMVELGFNYRLSDLQCALGLSQLGRLGSFVARRQAIAERYSQAFAPLADRLAPLARRVDRTHAHHLYVLRVRGDRAAWYQGLRRLGIGVNVHYRPVYLHSYYRQRFGHHPGLCPVAEAAYEEILSLPIYPAMTEGQVDEVIDAVQAVAG